MKNKFTLREQASIYAMLSNVLGEASLRCWNKALELEDCHKKVKGTLSVKLAAALLLSAVAITKRLKLNATLEMKARAKEALKQKKKKSTKETT